MQLVNIIIFPLRIKWSSFLIFCMIVATCVLVTEIKIISLINYSLTRLLRCVAPCVATFMNNHRNSFTYKTKALVSAYLTNRLIMNFQHFWNRLVQTYNFVVFFTNNSSEQRSIMYNLDLPNVKIYCQIVLILIRFLVQFSILTALFNAYERFFNNCYICVLFLKLLASVE